MAAVFFLWKPLPLRSKDIFTIDSFSVNTNIVIVTFTLNINLSSLKIFSARMTLFCGTVIPHIEYSVLQVRTSGGKA